MGDDIVFDEVSYREPQRLRRPDRDRRWAVLAYEVPAPDELPIFLDRKPADAIERHALRDTSVELGGVLLGKECVDDRTGEPFVWVTESLEARHYENTQASFTYTHDSWEEITRERDAKHPDLDIVGWYHTHPDFGIFLSGHDQFIHRNFFAQPLQTAYVVDPIRQTRGFFQWRDGSLVQLGGFYLLAGRAERSALARLVNDLENTPDAAATGGALSPRLEAELIAMLARPTQQAYSPDRALTSAAFSLLGLVAGALIVLLVFGFLGLLRQVQSQTEAITELRRSVSQVDDARRLAEDSLADPADPSPSTRFATRYGKVARERDELRNRYDNQVAGNDALGGKLREAEIRLASLKAEVERSKPFEEEAKEAEKLRSQLAKLIEHAEELEKANLQQSRALEATAGVGAESLVRKYSMSWYAAVAGWSVALMAGLGLMAVAFRAPPEEGPARDPTVVPLPVEPPAHQIT